MTYRVVPIGGRVKAASIGLSHLFVNEDPVELDAHLKRLRDRPALEHLLAFFPSDHARMRQVLSAVGFYRPSLKTDQGMPGNFLRFTINACLADTPLLQHQIVSSEFLALPEPHAHLDPEVVRKIQRDFFAKKFRETAEALAALPIREAEKGRLPFFLIRPAQTENSIVFGADIVKLVEEATCGLIARICDERSIATPRLIWCQPDLFILNDGTVMIERLNCPDVGLFLRTFQHPDSVLLPAVAKLMEEIKNPLCDAIVQQAGRDLVLLTRDEVVDRAEDLLELGEITELKSGLEARGCKVSIQKLSDVDQIPSGQTVLLLNLDHNHPAMQRLYERADQNELTCFPHPRFQAACRETNDLVGGEIPERHQQAFLSLVGSEPKNETAHRDVMERIERQICKDSLTSPILYATVGGELVPILRRSLHSWRQLKRRAERHTKPVRIRLANVPATPDNLLLTGEGGARLHVYRFLVLNN